MKKQTKLFPRLLLTILLTSILPIVAISIFVLTIGLNNLRDETFNHLESIASIQKARVQGIIDQYRSEVGWITGRIQLKKELVAYLDLPDQERVLAINQIFVDSMHSIPDIKNISLYSLDGIVIASTNTSTIGSSCTHMPCVFEGLETNDVRDFILQPDNSVVAHLSGPVKTADNTVIGVIVVDIGTTAIDELVADYSGLQTTGETIIALRDDNGDARFIHPLRFAPDAAMALTIPKKSTEIPITQALLKNEAFHDDLTDYRGNSVLAVTAYIEDVDWGMVVKIDREEALSPVSKTRNALLIIIAYLLIILIFISLYWAKRISQPISELTQAALHFGEGQTDARALVNSNDEIGTLAASFNKMADNITEHQAILETHVNERTAQLREEIEERKQVEQALRESEKNYRLSIDESPLPIRITNSNGEVIYGNKALLELYGFETLEDFVNAPLETRYSGESLAFIQHLKDTFLTSNETITEFELDINRPDGETRHVAIHSNDIIWNGENMVEATYTDLTETRKLQQMMMSRDRLASIGQLVSGVAHELNNPLTGIIGFADLLLARNDITDDMRSDIEMINREAHRTADIVKNLLTFSRNQPQVKGPLNINEIIRTVLSLRKREQTYNHILVEEHLASDLPDITGNASQLHQVLYNLVINAEYFMSESHNGGTLTIVTESVNKNVKITLSDDGPGIPADVIPMIFNPFYTTKKVGEGTGLGLSISYGIITEHGGTIQVQSEEGHGTTFIIEFPVHDDQGQL